MTAERSRVWEFWIDRGGTFTDIVARDPAGVLHTNKVLSHNPEQYEDAVLEGVRRFLALAPGAPIPAEAIGAVKLGTTVATNALLERQLAPTVFVTNTGFGDALTIGDQSRPDIFALHITRPEPLQAQTITISARCDANGAEIAALDEDAARTALQAARARGCVSVAVCLLHACANRAHEDRLAALAREVGFAHISLSSDVDPLVKFVPRARTTVADAALTPILRAYLDGLREALGATPLYLMTSGGGLMSAEAVSGRDVLLSGPAGGVIGMAKTAQRAGIQKTIGFDMGGTSTDVSRFDGDAYERAGQTTVSGWTVRAPMLSVHTVAAGGGSVLHVRDGRAQAGPASAGATPGPACYGRGGPAAVTDANVVLGRLDPRFFPSVFGPQADQPLDPNAAKARLRDLAAEMGAKGAVAAAAGFVDVAVENMAQAIKQISTARGVDPRDYALASFGGAGGQLACRVAESLGMRRVCVHPLASLQSALGIGLADLHSTRETAFAASLNADGLQRARATLDRLGETVREALMSQGATPDAIRLREEMRLRYTGSDTALAVPFRDAATMREAFEAAHQRLFGFTEPESPIESESLAVDASAAPAGSRDALFDRPAQTATPAPMATTLLRDRRGAIDAPVYDAEALQAGATLTGPALLIEPHSQIVVDAGWSATRQADGMLVLEHRESPQASRPATLAGASATASTPDPVLLELFNRRFMAAAEDMGVVLERTAKSVNMKERLDFSCAVFDAEGGLVANAPHMPVHLGSMGASVRAVMEALPSLSAGDAAVVNAPKAGGTHLPDVTVITPVCDTDTGERLFFVAARGHHADIGGVEPGSMPPFSRTLTKEGVVLTPQYLLKDGVFQEAALHARFTEGSWPARNPAQNLADLKAQLAACQRGAQHLLDMVAAHGRTLVRQYLQHVQDNAEASVRRVIDRLSDGEAVVPMDAGADIRVRVTVDRKARSAVLDFTGTSPQQPTNFNAPSAITRAAALYVFRCLAGDDIPLNDGCLKPLTLILPRGSLLDPGPEAAVVAGNVETSQHIVDALFAATGGLANGQGSMNNLTFGDAERQYYETIAGGAPAGPGGAGAAAVHTHMTNSRMTDPEVLELRYPVRVEAHEIRRGSGGDGAHAGGDGAIRRVRFLAPMRVALLSTRRAYAPQGLAGGGPAAPGTQTLTRADGRQEDLDGCFHVDVEPGDVLEVRTPGGGGWGASRSQRA